MKILIVNQHTSNHGDEAAGLALMKPLSSLTIVKNISVLYNAINLQETELLGTNIRKIIQIYPQKLALFDKCIIMLTFILPFFLSRILIAFSGTLRRELGAIKDHDLIVNGPGGVAIGPYKRWRYLWRLFVALKLKKELAIYSISFGPLPNNFIFKKASIFVLSKCKFLSLRDKKSQEYAEKLGIPFTASIDTAFLSMDAHTIKADETHSFTLDNYVVIVPNALHKWHPSFKKYNNSTLDSLFQNIIREFLTRGFNIVLLPQLYGTQDDEQYFRELAGEIGDDPRILVVDPYLDSDEQQKIIKSSEFVVGARYHSIIFSIKNGVPFYSLSYEHKMKNTLELLELDEYCTVLLDLMESRLSESDIMKRIFDSVDKRTKSREKIFSQSQEAKNIALETFLSFSRDFLCLK